MNEAQFQKRIVQIAKRNGWLVFHPKKTRLPNGAWVTPFIGDAGFPDLVLVRPPKLLFVELKKQNGQPSKDQIRWVESLRACGVDAFFWRPDELGYIQSVLETGEV